MTRRLAGALLRGLGRGARDAPGDPGAPAAVLACIERDHRWWTQVDERAVYLARLIRDLALPVSPVLALLRDHRSDTAFDTALDVLEALGRAGDPAAVDGVRAYVHDGPRWTDVLQAIAAAWPRELWDDLLPVALDRLDGDDAVLWRARPWPDWAARDERIAARVGAYGPPPRLPRPFGHHPTGDLLAVLRTGGVRQRTAALRELNRRGPQPALLAVVDDLAAADPSGPLGRAVELLGPDALAPARAWARPPDHPMAATAYRVLAAHGDGTDLAALFEGWDRLDRADGLCGYDVLATGIARIGGPLAREAVPRLLRAWITPHSYERAAYLRAVTALDPAAARPLLVEGLWDGEADVRLYSAGHVALDDVTRDRLRYLRDDPMEAAEVRAVAGSRGQSA